MSCYHPLFAVDNGIDPLTGKHKIKFLPQRADFNLAKARSLYGESLMLMPCGHCVACAKDYARTWQARIMCESEFYDKTCFLTLTYREAPEKPSQTDLREFIKKLRNHFGKGIKFFACGEKGEVTKRSHAHMILFGVDFLDDAVIHCKRGTNLIYTSKLADELWSHGFVSIGSLDVASAGYVSQYCDKKKISSKDDGEFLIMSRGLGKRYFEKYRDEIFNSDYLYFNGNKFKIPRYFLKLADQYFDSGVFADDLRSRKRETAIRFRYDRLRSFVFEEEAMQENANIDLAKYVNKEKLRDVY